MFNPMQAMQMFQNPQQVVGNLMQQGFQQNPLFQRAVKMAEGKTPEQLQQVAQNLCQQRGIDFNEAWRQFQAQFGGMR